LSANFSRQDFLIAICAPLGVFANSRQGTAPSPLRFDILVRIVAQNPGKSSTVAALCCSFGPCGIVITEAGLVGSIPAQTTSTSNRFWRFYHAIPQTAYRVFFRRPDPDRIGTRGGRQEEAA